MDGNPRHTLQWVRPGHGARLGAMGLDEFVSAIEDEIRSCGAVTVVERFGN